MAYVSGYFDRDKLEAVRERGYDICAVGIRECSEFWANEMESETSQGELGGSDVLAVVYVDCGPEELFE